MIVNDLKPSERQRCEVWTRVMGYHRPTTSFNKGRRTPIISNYLAQDKSGRLRAAFCCLVPHPQKTDLFCLNRVRLIP